MKQLYSSKDLLKKKKNYSNNDNNNKDTPEDGQPTEGLVLSSDEIIVNPAQSVRIKMKIRVVKENANNKVSQLDEAKQRVLIL